ncbi:MAG TPA: Rieske 2Fe-2S domain-containing protein [Acidobacteriaceae bacterium]|nr:Rieske 2Fe-2S domain-containing protein [Acidobacteriaceae bacterium]
MTDIVHEEQKITKDDPRVVSRRWLLLKIGIGFNALVGLAIATPIVRYLVGPIRGRKFYDSWVSLGPLSQFPVGETRLATYENPFSRPWDGATDKTACWVRHVSQSKFQVFAINCAHLGCPVRWFPQSELFMCPCHGGVYYANGDRASGPPERGLFTYDYKIVKNQLHIFAGQTPTLANRASLQMPAEFGSKGCGSCAG